MTMDYRALHFGGDTIVVAFASGDQRQFQFQRSLSDLGVSFVVMRDSRGHWYQDGVAGIGHMGDVAAWIGRLKSEHGYKRVITLGLSSGAYGALLYGQISQGVDQVIAISPVTGMGEAMAEELRTGHGKLAHLIPRIMPDPARPIERAIADLRTFYPAGPIPQLHGFVSDGDGTELDRFMFERLLTRDQLFGMWYDPAAPAARYLYGEGSPKRHSLSTVAGYSHGALAKALIDRGTLAAVIRGEA